MRTTLKLFMQVLMNLVKRKSFKVRESFGYSLMTSFIRFILVIAYRISQIYVHPVPSVLKETRHLVIAYNILYEQAVKALPSGEATIVCTLISPLPPIKS